MDAAEHFAAGCIVLRLGMPVWRSTRLDEQIRAAPAAAEAACTAKHTAIPAIIPLCFINIAHAGDKFFSTERALPLQHDDARSLIHGRHGPDTVFFGTGIICRQAVLQLCMHGGCQDGLFERSAHFRHTAGYRALRTMRAMHTPMPHEY